jgi:hypothetical protein
MAGRIGHVINRRASRVERANKPELPVHPDIVPVVQGSFRNTGPGERVAPRSESLSLDALDEEVVPVLNTLIHVYVRMLIAWRKSSVSPSMKRGLPDARPHS